MEQKILINAIKSVFESFNAVEILDNWEPLRYMPIQNYFTDEFCKEFATWLVKENINEAVCCYTTKNGRYVSHIIKELVELKMIEEDTKLIQNQYCNYTYTAIKNDTREKVCADMDKICSAYLETHRDYKSIICNEFISNDAEVGYFHMYWLSYSLQNVNFDFSPRCVDIDKLVLDVAKYYEDNCIA